MVTNRLQKNVPSAGFMVYLVETTDMQQFTLAVCVVVAVAQRFSHAQE